MSKPKRYRATVMMTKPYVLTSQETYPTVPTKDDVLEALANAILDQDITPTDIDKHFNIEIEAIADE